MTRCNVAGVERITYKKFLFSSIVTNQPPELTTCQKVCSERVQAFSMETLRIFQTSLTGFVHNMSSEFLIWNSFQLEFGKKLLIPRHKCQP
jgi:hypothetical protein